MSEQSPGLKAERKLDYDKLTENITDTQQKEAYGFYLRKFEKAREQRHQKREEFDDLDLETDYILNKRAANAYLPPKKNDDEVRIVTGTTEKKIEVVFNELVGMNLQPEAQVFDKNDNELRGLGQDFMDIVTRTNQIERDDDFWRGFVRELLTQRAVFIEETDEYTTYYNRGTSNMMAGTIKKEKRQPVTFHRARKRLLTNLQIFLGDCNIPARRFQEQPYILKYVRRTYAEAKTVYEKWMNWSKVIKGGSLANSPFGYRMYIIDGEEVEEIHYLDPHNDEYQIMINGVLMFDEPAPLFYMVTEDRRYPMTMTVLKEMGEDCAYGKPLTASAKTLQGLNSETIRLLIKKFRQVIEPPLASKGRKIFSKDIWTAGAVTYGLSANDFEVLNKNNQGITNSEFSLYDLIEKKTEEFIGAKNIGGETGSGGANPTATQIISEQRQFIKQLGLSVLAFMTAKRDVTYLRIYNLLENFVSPVSRELDSTNNSLIDIYEKFTIMDAQFENGKRGKKIVQFVDKPVTPDEMSQVYQYEQGEEMAGRPTRIRFINAKMLSEIPSFWYVTVAPRERDGSALSKVMFADKLKQAVDIMTVTKRPLNDDKVIDEYEFTWQIKDMFKKTAPANQAASPEAQEQGDNLMAQIDALDSQMQEGEMGGQMNKPSLNTMVGNAQ